MRQARQERRRPQPKMGPGEMAQVVVQAAPGASVPGARRPAAAVAAKSEVATAVAVATAASQVARRAALYTEAVRESPSAAL